MVDPEGWIAAASTGDGEAPIAADLDLSRSRDKRTAEFADALADRRPDLYSL